MIVYTAPPPPRAKGAFGPILIGKGGGRAPTREVVPRDALERRGGTPPPPPSRAPSLRPATVPLTPSASLNGICNRQ